MSLEVGWCPLDPKLVLTCRYEDVVAANARGQVWLILDNMVLDIKSWLPEHPGGSSIIPRQSLNGGDWGA